MSLKHKVLSGLMAAALSASLLACSSAPAPAASSAPASSLPSVSHQTETPSYAYQRGTVQNTRYGTLEGFSEDGALHWFGVPYAQAPVNELRWKAPQPLEPWEGTLDATESMVASQTASVQASKDKAGNGTVEATTALLGSEEGAVTLDITRPDTDETGLPIFFYIHGGNNQTGKSAAFPATQFAQEVNCVVVSVNHRLGLLGYNALPAIQTGTEEENSGNFGLLDLAAALDWVAENAESFGGDSGNITVTGSSAGGRNVMAMLISPVFEGKFQKAISYSGGMTVADMEDSQRVEARVKLTDVLENRSERNRWINHFMQFSTMEDIDRRAVMQLIRSIRVMGKDELHIEFNYQDEYQKAVSLAEQIAAHNEERKVG